MTKDFLWDWVFQFNPFINKFMAVKKENYHELTNGDKGNVIYADTYPDLEKKIKNKFG